MGGPWREGDLRGKVVYDAQGVRIGTIRSVILGEGRGEEILSATMRLDRWLLTRWAELATDSIPLDPSRIAVVEAHTLKLSLTHAELRASLGGSGEGSSRTRG